jgi:chromosome partitioning protein
MSAGCPRGDAARQRQPERIAVDTVAVFNTKGGSGKSSLTIFLAEFLASKACANQRVLVVDLDPQQSTAGAFLGDDRLLAAIRTRRTFTQLLEQRLLGPAGKADTELYLAERPVGGTRGGVNYLQSLQVLPCDREGWFDLNERLIDLGKAKGPSYADLVREALVPLANSFEVCLIDFPAHDRGPLVRCGLRAADWWLFPVQPDRLGARDLDGPRQVILRAYKDRPRRIRGLGTVLMMCPNRGSEEYKRSARMLTAMADRRAIPKLFGQACELPFSTDAKNALNETLRPNTLVKKFNTTQSALHQALLHLGKEVVKRLRLTPQEVETEGSVNDLVTKAVAPTRR